MAAKEVTLTDKNPYTSLGVSQRRYVEARLQGLTPGAAEKAAGIKGQGHTERNPKIRAAIKFIIRDTTQSAAELSKNDVMTGMLDAVNAAATSAELVMAWRELGKLIGAYEPERKILEIHDYKPEDLKTLSEEELALLAGKRMRDAIAIDGEYEELTDSASMLRNEVEV